MNYGGAYRDNPARLVAQAAAENLSIAEDLLVNKEQRVPDIQYFSTEPDAASTSTNLLLHGQEFHTSYWGHLGLLNLTDHFLLPDFAVYPETSAASLFPPNAVVADLAHAQHGLVGYAHPFDSLPDPADKSTALTDELPVDVALGKVDYIEVLGFSDHKATTEVWYRLLNCGFRIPAGAGTDAMANFASLRGPVGLNRVYVKTGPTLDHRRWLEGIKSGRTFATNGPLLEFTLGGKEAGNTVHLLAAGGRLTVTATLRSIVPVDHLEIVGNGEVVADIPLAGDRTLSDWKASLNVERSGWYTLRAWGASSARPILDIYPFATTSPIYVSAGDSPVRSPNDARYFASWIDRLIEDARSHPGWNDAAESAEVLRQLDEAKAIYESQMEGPRESARAPGR